MIDNELKTRIFQLNEISTGNMLIYEKNETEINDMYATAKEIKALLDTNPPDDPDLLSMYNICKDYYTLLDSYHNLFQTAKLTYPYSQIEIYEPEEVEKRLPIYNYSEKNVSESSRENFLFPYEITQTYLHLINLINIQKKIIFEMKVKLQELETKQNHYQNKLTYMKELMKLGHEINEALAEEEDEEE